MKSQEKATNKVASEETSKKDDLVNLDEVYLKPEVSIEMNQLLLLISFAETFKIGNHRINKSLKELQKIAKEELDSMEYEVFKHFTFPDGRSLADLTDKGKRIREEEYGRRKRSNRL